MPRGYFPRKPRTKAAIKGVAACRRCHFVWKPESGFTVEKCPKCGHEIDVRQRKPQRRDIEGLKRWRKANPGHSTKATQRYYKRALMLVGRGKVACVRCGCDRPALIEINHINGGGRREWKRIANKFYADIARLKRVVDDLELLCKPCNAVHALELKHGKLPFVVMWNGGPR